MAALDHPWDETYPADLTQASFFAAALRAFKIDVRQRMVAFGAGPLGDRPVPDASFGGANDGVTYQATDTGQTFRYNGAAWVDITSAGFGRRLLYLIGPQAAVVGTGLGNFITGAQYVLPGLTIPLGKAVHYAVWYSLTAGPANVWEVQGMFSGQSIHIYSTPIADAPPSKIMISGYILNLATGTFLLNNWLFFGASGGTTTTIAGGLLALAAIDFTKDQPFLFQLGGNAANQMRVDALMIQAVL